MVSSPAQPDPVATARAQGEMNRETAITQFGLNAHNQVNPWGTTSWEQTGAWQDGTPRYTQTSTLSPSQQAIFDQSQEAQTNLAGIASDQSLKLRDYLNNPFEFTNRDAETWAYDLASPRILNQQRQNEDQLRSTLAAKGIREGSAAWNAEMGRLTNANTDQLNQLALTGRGQAFSEALAGRNQPINEITALMSGSQVANPAQMNAAGPQTSVAGVDYTGLVRDNYKAQVAETNAMNGGLFGLGSAGLGLFKFSDVRLKENIRRVGKTDGGVPVYVYNYRGDPQTHMGVMAHEAQDEAVAMHPSGYLMVDYSRIE